MRERYDSHWIRKFGKFDAGNEELDLWKDTLSAMSNEQFDRAMKKDEERDSEFAPNRKTFRKFAYEKPIPRPSHKPFFPLISSTTEAQRKEAAVIGLAEARKRLGMR